MIGMSAMGGQGGKSPSFRFPVPGFGFQAARRFALRGNIDTSGGTRSNDQLIDRLFPKKLA